MADGEAYAEGGRLSYYTDRTSYYTDPDAYFSDRTSYYTDGPDGPEMVMGRSTPNEGHGEEARRPYPATYAEGDDAFESALSG
jgi:hypothetical protein